LHEHQAVRMKLGHMARQMESLASWIDQLIYQLTKMEHIEALKVLGDRTCLIKVQASKTLE